VLGVRWRDEDGIEESEKCAIASLVERHGLDAARKFGWPYWIEVIDTAGEPAIAWGQLGQHGRGECF